MANHPNRDRELKALIEARAEVSSVTIRRVYSNVIEYSINEDHTYHANRIATFHGPHTGGSARQVMGPAKTMWRERDDDLIKAFQRKYPNAEVTLA